MRTRLTYLEEQRAALHSEITRLVDEPVPNDRRAAEAANAHIEAEQRRLEQLDDQIRQVREATAGDSLEGELRERLGMTEPGGSGPGRFRRGFSRGADSVYARGNGASYFRDLVISTMPSEPGFCDAQRRLQDHAQVIARAANDLPDEFRATGERRAAGTETRTNPNRTDGQGGYFVPPLWLVDEYVDLLRNGRATADRCTVRPLPPGTDSINLPKVATGTATGVQTADAGSVSSTDLTDTSVTAPVRTIAGQQDVAIQLRAVADQL
ncbi:hypothetical protein [Nocardioides sp.]|uniref:hypothetical protein n=1 Tax=Nocardioides sp. TaxID=35761 RepID=UPI003782E7F0